MKKVLFTATVDSHILHFHIPYLKLFKENGYEVHVATNGEEEIPYCDVKHKISLERSPIKLNNLKAIKALKKVIDEENFEIIHTHTPMGSVVTRLAAMSARKKGTRVIYTAHGFHFFKGAPLKNWLIFYPIEKILSRITDDLILINSEDYNLAKKKFHAKRTHLVPGVGVDPNKFNFEFPEKEKQELRKSLGLKKTDFVMIYPAELSKRKNQKMLIEVMKELVKKNKNFKLLLPGLDSFNGKYQEMVKEYKLKNNIKFLGYRKDIPKLLRISNLSVSSALQEGLPVNLLEAMQVGMPIVATDCRGNRDLVVDGENGYIVEINDVNNMKDRIYKIYKEKNRKHYKDANKKLIKKYVLDTVLSSVEEIYKQGEKNMNKKKIALIIPSCTDLNRGDQALVYETAEIIKETYNSDEIYMMTSGETSQCQKEGLKIFSDVLKHPSRFNKKNNNINYGIMLKIKWGIIAIYDLIITSMLLNKITRKFAILFLDKKQKEALELYKKCEVCFVKGGGFIHDYSGGLVGLYTMYYQLFHIMLAQSLNKPVYIMPNSYGPFKNKLSAKMVNKVMNKCEFVSARESISASKETNGLDRDILLYPDLAFFLRKSETFDEKKYFKEQGLKGEKKYVAITVRPYRFAGEKNPEEKYQEYKEAFKKFILWLNEKKYFPLLFVHTRAENDHENDEKCIKEICEMINDESKYQIIKDDSLSCRELKALYSNCEYIVGTRFHSVIFSVTQGVPAISVTYGGNKGEGIMKDIDSNKFSIKISELDFEELKRKFLLLEENREKSLKNISDYIEKANKQRKIMINDINEKRRI